MKSVHRHLLQVLGTGVAVSMLSAPVALAQQDQPQVLEKVQVTGSNIRRADAETPSPVQVITAEDIQKSGYTTITDVLQHITANGQGTLSQGFPQAFAGGASGISLRGLNTSATLVLIDGHRMAPYPLSDDGQRSFVDISNIPFNAVERIEVLKDGASAVYGSDAIAGVVNIILKKSFIGTNLTYQIGTATEGGGTTTLASVMHGFGNYDTDGYNIFFNAEYRHQDPILYSQRAGDGQWQSLDFTGYGGASKVQGTIQPANPTPATLTPYLVTTAAGVPFSGAPNSTVFFPGACSSFAQLSAGGCAFQNPRLEIEPRTQNLNLLASLSKKINDNWKLDVKASFFDSQGEQVPPTPGQTYPQSYSQGLALANGIPPHFVGTTIPSITVPATYPGNTLGAPANVYGVIPGAPIPITEYDSKASRIVGELTGSVGAWDLNAALGYTQVITTQTEYGSINIPALNAALNRAVSPFNILGPNTAADMSTIFPVTGATDTSKLEFGEVHASRPLMKLQGGDLGLSFGGSYIHRDLEAPAPWLVAQGVVPGNGAYVSGAQTNEALYAELAAPVLKTLELDASVRYDHFNNSQGATTPKVGFKWTPTDIIAFRGTWGQGFRAPNSAENGSSGTPFGANTSNDPDLCPSGPLPPGTPYPKNTAVKFCNYGIPYLGSANPALSPEKSTSETFGLILEPIKGWASAVDFYQVDIKNQIVSGTPTNAVRGAPITTTCDDGTGHLVSCTSTNVATGLPEGPVEYYPVPYINANSTKVNGVELDTRYRFKLGEAGTLLAVLDWSHTLNYYLTTGGTTYQLAGTHGPFIIGGDTANPRDRVQASLTWDRGPWQVASIFNYISGYTIADPSAAAYGVDTCIGAQAYVSGWFPQQNAPSSFCNVKSFLTVDFTARYVLSKKWSFNAGILNAFNQQPPVDIGTYGGGYLPYNPSMHLSGAVGRFVQAGFKYNF
jgi:iron complex outermembrane receptor protein